MTKNEFIAELRKRLSGLPEREIEERIGFYSEMIDDRIEEGTSEEAAVADIGPIDGISDGIIRETPIITLAKERIKPKRTLRTWEIVLIVLGAPIWLSLAIAALSVALSLYIAIWSVIVSLWATFGSFVAAAPATVIIGIVCAFTESGPAGLALVGAGLLLAGVAIFLFFGSLWATKGTVILTKTLVMAIKRKIAKREVA